MTTARDLLSSRVVTVFSDQRLGDAADLIAAKDASYCAVIERDGGQFVGIVRLRDVAARSADRIFYDLIAHPRPLDVHEDVDSRLVARALQAKRCDEAVVLTDKGDYLGLVTRESLLEWALNEQDLVQRKLEKEIENRQQVILQRTDELRNALVEAERYATLVSHDLRLPLRSIHAAVDRLARDGDLVPEERGKRQLQRIRLASVQMEALIESFLEEARLSRSRHARLTVPLERVVDEAIAHCDALIRERRAELNVQRPLHEVHGRHVVVLQIVSNLLSNALKHVPAGRIPRVEISSERCDREVLLSIRDNGDGLPREARASLLEPASIGELRRERPGLGLLIVKRAVRRLGGRIMAESDAQGSTVMVRLPQPPPLTQPQTTSLEKSS